VYVVGRVVVRSLVPSAWPAGASSLGKRGHYRLAAAIFIAGLAVCALSSCSKYDMVAYSGPARIPLPKRTLLEPPPEPNCMTEAARPGGYGSNLPGLEHHRTAIAGLAAAGMTDTLDAPATATPLQSGSMLAQTDPNLGLSLRIRLEYERDCYRRAEIRARERLLQLQRAVSRTAKAVKRTEQSAP
jgi:hypothetical protein